MRRDKTYNEALMLLKYYYRFFYNVKKVSRKKMIENIRLFFDEFRYLPDCKVLKSFVEKNKRFLSIAEQNLFNDQKEMKRYSVSKARALYASDEWQKLRYEVLKEQGARCACCGRTPADGCKMHVDHIIPLSKDWSKRFDKNNLQVLCEDCNLGKSNGDSIDWRLTS